uniref:Formamidopyrimidine-DNA glycosylase catalytic domain-containing protein n=1 Tax=viral metagenome TaxID=1070528 RepID=A0A6C0BRF0_9ZZZZ
MPEGPNIRKTAQAIRTFLAQRSDLVADVECGFAHLHMDGKVRFQGSEDGVQVHGKTLFLIFIHGLLEVHAGMTGTWTMGPVMEHHYTSYISFTFSCGNVLTFILADRIGKVNLYPGRTDPQGIVVERKWGPDIYTLERQALLKLFSSNRRSKISTLLMNQKFLAGIGNYLRSEILYVAGLHGDHRLVDLSYDQRVSLANAVHDVYRYYTDCPHPVHKVYRKSRDPDGHRVQETRVSGRSLFWVPEVQH